ncbi:MAG: HU family DNA-binding protein [Syntrophorhabdus sp.]
MTKTDIIEKIAGEVKISKAAAAKAFEVFISSISSAMKNGDKVTIIGFGTFSVASRKARKGRNPRTGETIKIAASKTPKFSAGATLKATVNGKAASKPAKKAPAKAAKKASPAAKPAKATKPAGKSKK